MRLHALSLVTALVLIAGVHSASAQDVRGITFGGVTGDANGQQFPAFGGGVLVDLGQPWGSAGIRARCLAAASGSARHSSALASGSRSRITRSGISASMAARRITRSGCTSA